MVRIANKNISIKKIILSLIALVIGVPLLYILYLLISSPILDEIDKSNFKKFQDETKAIYSDFQKKSGGIETFTYKLNCYDIEYGVFSSNEQRCSADIYTSVPVRTPEQAMALHNKYYDVVDKSDKLTPESDLKNTPSGYFGNKMIVSGVEKSYKYKDIDSTCSYVSKITHNQNKNIEPRNFGLYGAAIEANNANSVTYFSCGFTTRNNWVNE